SHSTWNNTYSQNGSCTANDVKRTGVKFDQIKDQNAGLHKNYKMWEWLKNHSNEKLRCVYERMQASNKPRGDVSDAGMIWYLLKNDQNLDPDKLRSFFANGASTPNPKNPKDNGNDKDSGSGSNGNNCQASGNTLAQAIKNLEKACGIKYNKNKGHDCDPDGKGGWICSTGKVSGGGNSSGSGNRPGSSDPRGGGSGNCKASGKTLAQAKQNLQKQCGIKYNKNK